MIPLTVSMMDASMEAQWLADSSEAVRYVVIVILALFGGRGTTSSYTPKMRGRSTLSVVKAYSVGGGEPVGYGGGGEKGKLVQIASKCNE